MKKVTVGKYIRLSALLFIVCLVGFQIRVRADSQTPSWFGTGQPSLEKVKDVLLSELPYSLNGNTDCDTREVVTRQARLLPTPAHKLSSQSCVTDTNYGGVDSNYNLQRPGSSIAGPLLQYRVSVKAHVIPIPNSSIGLQVSGDNLTFTADFPSALSSRMLTDGTVEHSITKPPNAVLKDRSGTPLIVHFSAMSFSANGKWMIIGLPGIGMARVNLDTFEALPFGPNFNYWGGVSPYPRTAITSDGRYAVVASDSFTFFHIYDLASCAPVPLHITAGVDCANRDLLPFMHQNLANYAGASRIRFNNDYSLRMVGTSFKNNIYTRARYVLNAPGQSSFGWEYLGLGDSFASGEGAYEYKAISDTSNNKCHLSQRSYPYLIGSGLSFNQYGSVACSGAKIIDISNTSDEYTGQADDHIKKKDRFNYTDILASLLPGYLAQQEFVSKFKPSVITISAVGNDIGFKDKILRCLEPDTCYASYEDRLEIVREINAQFPRLTEMYQEIVNNSDPRTKIYVIGYPQLADPSGSCAANVRLNAQELEFSNQLVGYLNQVVKAAASKTGVFYVDTENALSGNRLCETDSWNVAVNGLTAGNDIFNLPFLHGPIGNESYHPNAYGQYLLKKKILEQTTNFTAVMPKYDLNASPPAENSYITLLNAPKTGRQVRLVSNYNGTANDVVYRQGWWQTTIDVTRNFIKENSPFGVWLNSTPVNLGTFNSDAAGNLSVNALIPADTPIGFHTVHIYGQNSSGEDIDIYKTIYVADSEADLDGDGLPNTTDPCTAVEPSGNDADGDGIDDACDPLIDLPPPPPIVFEPPITEEPPLEITVLTTANTPIQFAGANSIQSPTPAIFAASSPQVLASSTQIQQPAPTSHPVFTDLANTNINPIAQKPSHKSLWLIIIGALIIFFPTVVYFFKVKIH